MRLTVREHAAERTPGTFGTVTENVPGGTEIPSTEVNIVRPLRREKLRLCQWRKQK